MHVVLAARLVGLRSRLAQKSLTMKKEKKNKNQGNRHGTVRDGQIRGKGETGVRKGLSGSIPAGGDTSAGPPWPYVQPVSEDRS